MQISPIQQSEYNSLSFQALRGIKYKGFFDPKTRQADKNIVETIKNSESFKKFFKEFDTWLILDNTVYYKNTRGIFYILDINYKKASEKLSFLDKVKDFFKIFPKQKDVLTITQIHSKEHYSYEIASDFEEKIKNFTYSKMMKEHQKNISKLLKFKQNTGLDVKKI